MIENSRPRVTLCMIVKNEERNLRDCLNPIAELFDEIVIVDTGSVDETKCLAEEFHARVFDFPWCDDFAAARNESLRRASHPWIMWIDADDRLLPEQVENLRRVLNDLTDEPAAYMMSTVCRAKHACDGYHVLNQARLFHRHAELHWVGRVHEQLTPTFESLGYSRTWSGVEIEHTGYVDNGLAARKLHRDVRLLRMDYAVDPDNASTLFHLGLAYARLGKRAEAAQYLERILALGNSETGIIRHVYDLLADFGLREGKLVETLHIVDRGLERFPQDRSLTYRRAETFYEMDRYAECEALLREILAQGDEDALPLISRGEVMRKLAPLLLAEVLRLQGKFAASDAVYRGVLENYPRDEHVWYGLGMSAVTRNDRRQLDWVVQGLQACEHGALFASILRVQRLLLDRDYEPAGKLIEEVIAEAPGMIMPRMLRAEWLRGCNAPTSELLSAYRDVARLNPSDAHAAQEVARLEALLRLPAQGHQVVENPFGPVVVGVGLMG